MNRERKGSIEARAIAILAAQAAEAKKGRQVVVLDVREVSQVTDFLVVASSDNGVQLRAIADTTIERFHQRGIHIHHAEGYDRTGWILLDCGDVVVHYFLEERREFYALERLWGDAPRVEFSADITQGSLEKGDHNE